MNNLKALRVKSRITQEALAKQIGLTQEAISHYESGRRVPSLSRCRDIVRALIALGSTCSLGEAFPDAEKIVAAPAMKVQGGACAVQASSTGATA